MDVEFTFLSVLYPGAAGFPPCSPDWKNMRTCAREIIIALAAKECASSGGIANCALTKSTRLIQNIHVRVSVPTASRLQFISGGPSFKAVCGCFWL